MARTAPSRKDHGASCLPARGSAIANLGLERHSKFDVDPEPIGRRKCIVRASGSNGERGWSWSSAFWRPCFKTVKKAAREHRLDPGRIHVAGLPAGCAMAALPGKFYRRTFRRQCKGGDAALSPADRACQQ
ncbi:hypothetical protein EJI00_02490 [Variovorax sp. DXTD-1]|nr:hypothetical protein EJI00_02490 [Variovorax sp. DXTD-1]